MGVDIIYYSDYSHYIGGMYMKKRLMEYAVDAVACILVSALPRIWMRLA